MRKMDILIINPGKIRHDYVTEHLGIASLTAFVRSKGFQADCIDMAVEEMSVTDGVHLIKDIDPHMVGVSMLDDSKEKGIALIKALRCANFSGKIVVGGYFATFSSKEILSDFLEIDFVVRGEGEVTLVELMQDIITNSGNKFTHILGLSYRQGHTIIENQPRPLIEDLDMLPPVDRKYAAQVLGKGSQLRIYSTRGCWGQCSFCDIISMYRKSPGKVWRTRSIENLVDEIEALSKKYGINYFAFNDDQFLLKGIKALNRVEKFASELEKRKLKIQFELMCRADAINRSVMNRLKSEGLQRVFLGLESFDEKQLKRYNKRISVRQNLKAIITLFQLKIDVIASVILADAHTTLWDLLKQFIILFELRKRYFNSKGCQISINHKLEIYKGSPIYQEYKNQDLLIKDHYLEGYDFKLKFWTDLRLKLFRLETNLTKLFLRPVEILKNFIYSIRWHVVQIRNHASY
jgi:anaerobic magnesium-protoporphyrin IX monomethyl ester cyclase